MPHYRSPLAACLALACLFALTPGRAYSLDVTYEQTTLSIDAPALGGLRLYDGGDPSWDDICSQASQPCVIADLRDQETGETRFPPGGSFTISVTPISTDGIGRRCELNDEGENICKTYPAITLSCVNFNWSTDMGPCGNTELEEGMSLPISSSIRPDALVPGNMNSFASLYVTLYDYPPPDYMPFSFSSFQLFVIPDQYYGDNLNMAENWGGPADNPDTAFDEGGAGTCSAQGLPRYFVNTASLNLVIEDADFSWTSFGHDLALRRVWNQTARTGMFGAGWSFAYESTLKAKAYANGGASVRLGSGRLYDYETATISGQGTGTVSVVYAAASDPARKPLLTASITEATNVGTYVLYDKTSKLASTYAYSGVDQATGEYLYRLSSIADGNGNALTLAYDGNGRLTSLTDASGRAVTFAYNGAGLCSGFTVFSGQSASFTYDADGDLVRSVDLAGNVTTYAYDAERVMTGMTSAGKTVSFAYASVRGLKRIASVTDAAGRTTAYAMDASGVVSATDPGGRVRTYASENGRTTRVDGLPGGTVQTAYDGNGLPVSVTRDGGAATSFEYDENGNLTKRTSPTGGVTRFAYDANWNPTALTDAMGGVWRFGYDAKNNIVSKTTPLGRVTAYAYDAKGDLTRRTDPGGGRADMTYDAHGNLLTLSDPTGRTFRLTYDAEGLNLWKASDPRGDERSYVFDANRRLTRVNLPDAKSEQYGYDCCALSSVTDTAGLETRISRDALLRMTGLTDPLNRTTAYSYDAAGNLAAVTSPLNRNASLAYDAAGRLTSVTSPLGAATAFAYGDRGLLASLTTPASGTYAFTYDLADRPLTVTDPQGRTASSLTRDALGRVVSRTNARGQTVTMVRDADGRITAKKYASATVASYGWSAAGFLTSVTDGSGATVFTRDAAGRTTAIRYPDGKNLGLAYDAAGNLASLTYPGGLTATYVYDVLNRPTRVSFSGRTIDLAYDASGNLASETHSSGVTSRYAYDAAGRLTGVSHTKGATVIADISYTRNAAGEITRESGTWPLFPAFHSDADTSSYNEADAVTSWQGDAVSYDADGNLTAITGARVLSASYDAENRPVSLTMDGVTRTSLYDGLGRRVRLTAGSVVRNFHYDPFGRLLFETNASGTVTVCYLYAGAFILAQGTVQEGFASLLRDKTGSVLALAGDAGTVTAAYAYGDYGQSAGKTGGASCALTYVGALGVLDEGDGVFFMEHRLYDAVTGRFFQRDPSGFAGRDPNLYRYARSAPISRVDPLGLEDFEMTHWGWYDVNTAEGSVDLATGRTPHMAEPASDEELVAAGVIAAVGLSGMAGLYMASSSGAAVCAAGEMAAAGEATVAVEASSDLLMAEQIVANQAVVENMVLDSMAGRINPITELLRISNCGKDGQLILRAINKRAADLLVQGVKTGKGLIHSIHDMSRFLMR